MVRYVFPPVGDGGLDVKLADKDESIIFHAMNSGWGHRTYTTLEICEWLIDKDTNIDPAAVNKEVEEGGYDVCKLF